MSRVEDLAFELGGVIGTVIKWVIVALVIYLVFVEGGKRVAFGVTEYRGNDWGSLFPSKNYWWGGEDLPEGEG